MATHTDHASHTTTKHDEIRKWAESRGGKPACVKGTKSKGKDGGCLLRIDFPGGAGDESFEQMSWEEFFKVFDDNKLAMVYQDHKAGGEKSTFNKLVNRH